MLFRSPVVVTAEPEGTADEYIPEVGTGASGFPLTDQKQIETNLTSLGLDPAIVSVIAKNYAGKPQSVLNNMYMALLGQQQKARPIMQTPESEIMMTPEQMQQRGIPFIQQPEEPKFYRRGGLVSIGG